MFCPRSLTVISDAPLPSALDRHDGNNKPEKRQQEILRALQDLPQTTFEVNTDAAGRDDLERVHDSAYLDFLSSAHTDARARQDKDWYDAPNNTLLPYNIWPGLITTGLVLRQPVYKRAGLFAKDMMTPIGPNTFEQASRSAHNGVLAVNKSTSSDPRHPKVYFALNASPGHHAERGRYGGYCFLNNASIVAQAFLRRRIGRVGILDLDYHAGDGTQAIYQHSDQVITASIHMDPRHDYPNFTGFEDECGDHGLNLNVLLQPGDGWAQYRSKLEQALDHLFRRGRHMGALVIAFGADTVVDDPDPSNLAGTRLELDDYKEMGAMIAARLAQQWIPVVCTQEGGYDMRQVGSIVRNFLFGLIVPGISFVTSRDKLSADAEYNAIRQRCVPLDNRIHQVSKEVGQRRKNGKPIDLLLTEIEQLRMERTEIDALITAREQLLLVDHDFCMQSFYTNGWFQEYHQLKHDMEDVDD